MDHRITSEHDGGHLAVSVGDSITVSLAETATTGYRWEPDVEEASLRVTSDEAGAPAAPAGAPGQRVLTFEVMQPGATQLQLVCKRSWEEAVKERFAVGLDAAEA